MDTRDAQPPALCTGTTAATCCSEDRAPGCDAPAFGACTAGSSACSVSVPSVPSGNKRPAQQGTGRPELEVQR